MEISESLILIPEPSDSVMDPSEAMLVNASVMVDVGMEFMNDLYWLVR